ncbi:Putative auto-transporter adhesin, head GIN domain [Myroides guanonis]|uniref:Auto-transporter adhesin, head GIN domain n=2 Tax=Myroides guanonis TaxID=1150112 RepID=A0A1I3SIA4_9FLAO|nr:Putative auto-transporter adhesin, head GIN domain [Myroides guanonis]
MGGDLKLYYILKLKNMKNLMYAFLLVSASVLGQVKEERVVADFTSISVSQGIELEFVTTKNRKIVVETDSKEMLKYIKTEVKGKELHVFIENDDKKGFFQSNALNFKKLLVYVDNPQLSRVKVSSGAKMTLKNNLKSRGFDLSASSSGCFVGKVIADIMSVKVSSSGSIGGDFKVANDVSMDVSSSGRFTGAIVANKLSLEVSSSGKTAISGEVHEANVKVSSSGKIEASSLKVVDLIASASSSGKGVFTVSGSLDARASSSGSLMYYGNAKVIKSNTSSSGVISKKQS